MALSHILSHALKPVSSNIAPRSQGHNAPNPAWGQRQLSSWEEGNCWSLPQPARPASISVPLAVSGEGSASFSHPATASVLETVFVLPSELLKSQQSQSILVQFEPLKQDHFIYS